MNTKHTALLLSLILLNVPILHAQNECDHRQLLVNFLQKISSTNYKSSLKDYKTFFDSESEIEIALQDEYLKAHPNLRINLEKDSTSYAIDRFRNDKTFKRFLDLTSREKRDWIILKSHNEGTATIVYKIGIRGSNNKFYFQMVNWSYKRRCGISDIRDSTGNSIFFNDKNKHNAL